MLKKIIAHYGFANFGSPVLIQVRKLLMFTVRSVAQSHLLDQQLDLCKYEPKVNP